MINKDILNNIIDELEGEDALFDICQELAAFYIIQDHMFKSEPKNEVVSEFKDILPEYRKYVDIKRKYQKKELTESAVILSMQNVCTEIKQFLRTLYSCTDMPEEREQIRSMLVNLSQTLI